MIKQVIVMRNDLGMRRGKQIAQGAHASLKVFLDKGDVGFSWRVGGGGAREFNTEDNPHNDGDRALLIFLTEAMTTWVEGLFTKVCVQVGSEQGLLDIVQQAEAAGLPVALIRDGGKTEFGGVPTYTCCAIGPAEADRIDQITGNLALY